ncbi:MAG: ccpA [Schlesneria sp.]|nr:ccpA [Schlesneria sp.]
MLAWSLIHRVNRTITFVILLTVQQAVIPGAVVADEPIVGDQLIKLARESFSSLTPLAAKGQLSVKSAQVELGRQLFFDPRLSADGVWSCMLCHQPSLYGTDAQRLSRGVFDKFLTRNAPTVLNSSLQFKSHWDGKFEGVEDQAAHALLGPGFGNRDIAEGMARIQAIPGYADAFAKAFPADSAPITAANVGSAIGAYERTLLTPARFDEFLDGRADALSASEQQGLHIFIKIECVNCHGEAALGGQRYEKFGKVSYYWKETHSKVIDKGRYELTRKDEDLYLFKIASLRNVAMTPPYFHDGSVTSLPDAVRIMARVQLGEELSDDQNSAICAFLKSLTGTLPANFVEAPKLPPGAFLPVDESQK